MKKIKTKNSKNYIKSKKHNKKVDLLKVKIKHFSKTLDLLKRYYPEAHCALIHNNPFELLIATILSAQCTDERVNQVTQHLFKIFPNALLMSKADVNEIEKIIHPTGFYKNKAKNILLTSKIIVEKHNSLVPKQLDLLVELPGVGRKTANVVLGNSYQIISGIVVDTHVGRLAKRLGWTNESDPIKIEQNLQELCSKEDWIMLSHYLISHGRKKCKARSPQCETCFLEYGCPKVGVF